MLCRKTALQAFDAIVAQGEGASAASEDSHFQKFAAIREEYRQLKAANPDFTPAQPAATNPVLRRPPTPAGKVWLEHADAVATVDLANSCYQLMLRLLGYAYGIPRPNPENGVALDLGIALMRACTLLGERAARLPAGPSNPGCNAGMSFTALRDSAPFAPGAGARRFFIERLEEFAAAGEMLAKDGEARAIAAAKLLSDLAKRAASLFESVGDPAPVAPPPVPKGAIGNEETTKANGIETVVGEKITIDFEAMHSFAAMRDGRANGVPRQCRRTVDSSQHDGCRKAGGDCGNLSFWCDPPPPQ
ncbi:MAG: hypothetical protein ABL956_05825 [Hyphomonadaceae bacterium]